MSARRLLVSVALLSGCAGAAAQPESAAHSEPHDCAPEAVFVPNMNRAYEDEEGIAYPFGDTCLPCSHAIGFHYANGTVYLLDPDGRFVELAREGAPADARYRVVRTLAVDQVSLPKRRKILESLLQGGRPARADFEQQLRTMTQPRPPPTPKAPSTAEFVPDRNTPLAVPRGPGEQVFIGVRYEMNREHLLVDAMVYVIDPAGQLVQFRLADADERHGICNPVERFVEIGVIAWEAVEPAERAQSLRETLITRPTPEEYASFVQRLIHPPVTITP